MWPLLAQHEAGGGGIRETIDALARTPLSQIVIFVSICSVVRIALYGYLKKTVPHRRHGIYSFAKFANEAMHAMLGYAQPQLIGMEYLDLIAPEDQAPQIQRKQAREDGSR